MKIKSDMKCVSMTVVCLAGVLMVGIPAVTFGDSGRFDLLPGENDTKPALGPEPFPDRMSAFVWRNWGLVEVDRLAEVVGAEPKDLVAIAADFGLPSAPRVLTEWRDKGYITVVRRNWHLLPYDQLLTLLGFTREQFAFKLKEDDFLFGKLGDGKASLSFLADYTRKKQSRKG